MTAFVVVFPDPVSIVILSVRSCWALVEKHQKKKERNRRGFGYIG
jgi:hypothetical protein